MSGKKQKEARTEAVADAVKADPQALIKGQFALVRLDGAIEGAEAGVKVIERALKDLQEALGATKADRRRLYAEVERIQKAVGVDGKAPPPSTEAAEEATPS